MLQFKLRYKSNKEIKLKSLTFVFFGPTYSYDIYLLPNLLKSGNKQSSSIILERKSGLGRNLVKSSHVKLLHRGLVRQSIE